jgi:hypothetical protein
MTAQASCALGLNVAGIAARRRGQRNGRLFKVG